MLILLFIHLTLCLFLFFLGSFSHPQGRRIVIDVTNKIHLYLPLHTLSKSYDVPVEFVTPPHLRQCIDLFAVAEGRLLLDIG